MCASPGERQTGFAGWFKRLRHQGRIRDPTVETQADIMDMPFIRTFEEVAFEEQLASLKTQLRNDAVVPEVNCFDLWCGESDLPEEWFVDNPFLEQKKLISKSDSGSVMKSAVDCFLAATILKYLRCGRLVPAKCLCRFLSSGAVMRPPVFSIF